MTAEASTPEVVPTRSVGFLLGAGIFLLPMFFVWFLLRKGHSVLARVLGFGWFGLCMLIAFSPHPAPTPSDKAASAGDAAMVAAAKADAQAADKASGTNPKGSQADVSAWSYDTSKDDMRGTTTKTATVSSENAINLPFPYGIVRGRLTLRKNPRLNVILAVGSGQFLCNEYGHASVSVKFDNNKIERYTCSEAADGRSNEIFIDGEARFLSHLRHSSKVVIESDFYEAGSQQFTFPVSGLSWQ